MRDLRKYSSKTEDKKKAEKKRTEHSFERSDGSSDEVK